MSAHELSFPYVAPRNRDLSDAELWQRSLRRSVHRREITEAARKHAMRRKGAAVAVTASMAAGPVAAPFAAVASVGGKRSVSTQTAAPSAGSAIALPSGALVDYGDTGEAVAAVQKVVGVDSDGIFGPITQGGVERWQKVNGLPATGSVDAKTWTKMFQSSVSYVGKDGKTTVTVNNKTTAPKAGVDGPAPTNTTTTTKPKTRTKTKTKQRSAVAEQNRNAVTKPQSVSDQTVQAPAETPAAPAPATPGAGCGAGKIATPVSGTTTGVYGENRGSHAHAGKDIAAPTGTAVRAAQCGTVTKAGMDGSGYGNLVCIEHEGGVSTCYAHLSQINTKVGTYVHVGDVIGKVGCTGSCTGPHLHFEVRENGKTVNPEQYLTGAKQIAGKAATGKLAVTSSSSAAAWGEATPASSAETEATLAAAYTAATTATTPTTDPAATTPATTDATATAALATTDAAAPAATETAAAPTAGTEQVGPAETAPAAETPAPVEAAPAATETAAAPTAATEEAAPAATA
ncbi:peptidoglycan DD-metalloendopeptidase family protein, partial [Solirubrobacter phytolaccae]